MDRRDVVIEYLRGSGPGGQHRNKAVTGVRLHHLPTGCVAMATERRSQSLNLKIAFERLAARVATLLRPRTPRVATKPTAGAKRRRLAAKRVRGERKAARRRPAEE